MNTLHYNQIQFLKSASKMSDLPPDLGAEVAFVGRSNSGKSSAINTITGVSSLARTSKTPGRTQLINFFEFDPTKRLVDLPGYGYAKVPESVKIQWQRSMEKYLSIRESLAGLILIMDIRHPLKPQDLQMIEWTLEEALPVHILLTKADKLARGAAQNTLLEVKRKLVDYKELISMQLFSSLKRTGIDEAQKKITEWLFENPITAEDAKDNIVS